ncbi:MAG: SDR family NAD(P)-dependent oxidoreductase [Vulcanimicrobiaceae bacterium]
MPAAFDMSGKVALVTGASEGLGRHFAGVLARAGARVVLGARRREKLEQAVDEIACGGGSATAVALDVRAEASVQEAFAQIDRSVGPVDVVINNAGTTVDKPLLELSEAEWDGVVDTNLKGVWLVMREAARRMIDAKSGGCVVNITSILGERVAGNVSAYAASKAAVTQLTKAAALELARYGIRVSALAPGYIRSRLNDEFFESPRGQALIKRIPQRRLGSPADLDAPLLLLASDASPFMTGAVVVVDGGHLVSSL